MFQTLFDIRTDVRKAVGMLEEGDDGSAEEEEG